MEQSKFYIFIPEHDKNMKQKTIIHIYEFTLHREPIEMSSNKGIQSFCTLRTHIEWVNILKICRYFDIPNSPLQGY